ncbi:hypothetical protein CMI41_04910 [Candidatus Pacearchaeota archaeon]|nr:hypothetical protein [Candidatus Pacearchaeota archaeon]|tara:strand:+ start:3346 stop:3537 length:192 start_codon:yes stop_codon:yes gene_type:complete
MKLIKNHQVSSASIIIEAEDSRPLLLVDGEPVKPTELAGYSRCQFLETTVRDEVLLKAGGYKV